MTFPFTINLNLSAMRFYNRFDVGQAEAKTSFSFDFTTVGTIKLVKYAFNIISVNTYSVIFYGYFKSQKTK
jgi:hypothetical protein